MALLTDAQKKWILNFLASTGLGGAAPASSPASAQSPGPVQTPPPVQSLTPPTGGTDLQASCLIKVVNNSSAVLKLVDQGHDRGDFAKFPDKVLQPGATTDFISAETPDSADDGCKGFLVWQVGAPGDCTWRITWDNPEHAKNTSTSVLSGKGAKNYQELDQIGLGDENVPTEFTISGVGVPSNKPPISTATLEVRVLGLDQVEQQGATIKISGGPSNPSDGLTDAKGLAYFELLPGEYDVNAALKITTWNPVHVKQSSLVPGKKFAITIDKMNHGKLGITVKRGGAPEAGATVSVTTSTQNAKQTDGNGQTGFSLFGGTHQVSAVSSDGLWAGSIQAKVVAGDYTFVDIQLESVGTGASGANTGSVTVVITNLVTSAAVGSATVTVAGSNPTSIDAGTGKYVFENTPVGDQKISITAADYLPQTSSVTVTAGEDVRYNAVLEPKKTAPAAAVKTGNATVVVKDIESDAPIGDAKVSLGDKEPTSISAATGGYFFAAIPSGAQALGITAPNHHVYNGTVKVIEDISISYNAFMQPKKTASAPAVGSLK